MQKLVTDTIVHAHAARHLFHIGPNFFAQCRNFIDESDLCRQKSIGGIFDHLCTFQIRSHERKIAQIQRPVHVFHHVSCTVTLHANDNAVRLHKVFDRSSFAHKFRVRGYIKLQRRVCVCHAIPNPPIGPNRHCRFRNNHKISARCQGNFLDSSKYIIQVSMPLTTTRRCPNRNKNRICAIDCTRQIDGERQPPRLNIFCHQYFKPRFENWHLTTVQSHNFIGIFIDTDYIMPKVRKTDPGYQPDITGANHNNLHLAPLISPHKSAFGKCRRYHSCQTKCL